LFLNDDVIQVDEDFRDSGLTYTSTEMMGQQHRDESKQLDESTISNTHMVPLGCGPFMLS